VLFWT